MVKETFDLGDRKVEVIHSTEENASDLSPEEMEKWIEYTMRMRNGSISFEELYRFIDNEDGINNVTRFTVALERMEERGDMMVSKDGEATELLYLG